MIHNNLNPLLSSSTVGLKTIIELTELPSLISKLKLRFTEKSDSTDGNGDYHAK